MLRQNYPYLTDFDFLKSFDNALHKTQKIKIIILDFQENPIQEIQGRVISGSINVDGSSSIRRTCNLSMVADGYDVNLLNVNNLLAINKKVSIEIGFKNTFSKYKEYEYLWFPLGVYVIFNPNCSHSKNGLTISFQGKDKMCLLNGDCGGTFPASVVFHEKEQTNQKGEIYIDNPMIFQIITELVNHFGNERLENILISDVPRYIKRAIKWNGDSPIYLINEDSSSFVPKWDPPENEVPYMIFNSREEVGFDYTEFTYPGELIGNAGETVCTILDKIKNTLGNFEYFYDVFGTFIFREIKNYLNTTQAKVALKDLDDSSNYIVDFLKGKSAYVFDSHNLIDSYSNAPQYNAIKNDFVVWGERKNAQGNPVPIRFHLAIDKKPEIGNKYKMYFYIEPETLILKAKPIKVVSNLKERGQSFYCIYQIEDEYYEYYPEVEENYRKIDSSEIAEITTIDWREELYYSGLEASVLGTNANYYYAELANEWPKLFNLKEQKFYDIVEKKGTEIDFFLDFIDTSAKVGSLSVGNIGRRTKVVNDTSINCIFEPEIPNFIWKKNGEMGSLERESLKDESQPYIQVDSEIFNNFTTGGSYNSAFFMIKDLLYQYTNYNENISIVIQPMYYLEPNTLIFVEDILSGIQGDYSIKSFSIPLDIQGTMTLSCVKALEKI